MLRRLVPAVLLAPAWALAFSCGASPAADTGGAPPHATPYRDASAALRARSPFGSNDAAADAPLMESDAARIDDADDAADAASVQTDAMDLHQTSGDALLALVDVPPEKASDRTASLLRALVVPGDPSHMNQGNKAIALHTTRREQCLAGLSGVALQSPEQRATCGADNMVPVWHKDKKAAYCIDIFEFPNRACELPFVWSSPSAASAVCKAQGKRLCAQPEWQLACRADPDGGPDRKYAYGDALDLDVCNTHRPHREKCVPTSARATWATCTTDTEPSGSFPGCRSRFGVYDQHGNVAEEMIRTEPTGAQVSQLKGSAWFYSEVAREPDKPVPASTPYKEHAYSDTCNFDPRWHVEPIETAIHVNYHLGFRCCKSL